MPIFLVRIGLNTLIQKGQAKSEKGFFDFLIHAKKKTKAQARNEISLDED